MSQKIENQQHAPFFCKWCKEYREQWIDKHATMAFCDVCNNYGINIYSNKKEWFRYGKKDTGLPFTLDKKMAVVRHHLRGKGTFWIGTSKSDSCFERIVVTASSLEIHRHDIEDIEKVAELELSWMRFWFNPEWEKLEPKWFGKACNGKFWELMFVKDLRGGKK